MTMHFMNFSFTYARDMMALVIIVMAITYVIFRCIYMYIYVGKHSKHFLCMQILVAYTVQLTFNWHLYVVNAHIFCNICHNLSQNMHVTRNGLHASQLSCTACKLFFACCTWVIIHVSHDSKKHTSNASCLHASQSSSVLHAS